MEVNKEDLQRGVAECLCFLNIGFVLGHEVVNVTSTSLSIYSNCAGMFLIIL